MARNLSPRAVSLKLARVGLRQRFGFQGTKKGKREKGKLGLWIAMLWLSLVLVK